MGDYGDAIGKSIVAMVLIGIVLGVALLEGLAYLFNHISVSWVP